MLLTDEQLRCRSDCAECGGNGSIGGDTQSMYVCTRWTMRVMRYNRLGPYTAENVKAWKGTRSEAKYRAQVEREYGEPRQRAGQP